MGWPVLENHWDCMAVNIQINWKNFVIITKLEEVLLDVEKCLNNRPLMYNKEDPICPVLTPIALVFGQENALSCDIIRQFNDQLNINAKEFQPRRNAAAIADL